MHVIRHDAPRQQLVLAAIMVIEVFAHHGRNARIGKPLPLTVGIKKSIVLLKRLLVNICPMFPQGDARGRFLLGPVFAALAPFGKFCRGDRVCQPVRDKMSVARHVPMRQIAARHNSIGLHVSTSFYVADAASVRWLACKSIPAHRMLAASATAQLTLP